MKITAFYLVLPALLPAAPTKAAPARTQIMVQILYTQVSPVEMKRRHVNAHQTFDGPQGYQNLCALSAKHILSPKMSLGPRVIVTAGQSAHDQGLSVGGARILGTRITASIGLSDAEQQAIGPHSGLHGNTPYAGPSGDAVLLRRSYLAGTVRLTWAYVTLYPARVFVPNRPGR